MVTFLSSHGKTPPKILHMMLKAWGMSMVAGCSCSLLNPPRGFPKHGRNESSGCSGLLFLSAGCQRVWMGVPLRLNWERLSCWVCSLCWMAGYRGRALHMTRNESWMDLMCWQQKGFVRGRANRCGVELVTERTLLPFWMRVYIEGPLLPKKKGEEDQQWIRRFSFPKGLSWMEYFSFTFSWWLQEVSLTDSHGLAIQVFQQKYLTFSKWPPPIKQSGNHLGKDFDFMLFKLEKFSFRTLQLSQQLCSHHLSGVFCSAPEHGPMQPATLQILHFRLASLWEQIYSKQNKNTPKPFILQHPPCFWCMYVMPKSYDTSQCNFSLLWAPVWKSMKVVEKKQSYRQNDCDRCYHVV